MNTTAETVAGYSYNAAIFCPTCLPLTRGYVSTENRPAYAIADSVERVLDNLAAPSGKFGAQYAVTYGQSFDRHDEHSFDSDDFPKVVILDNLYDRRHVQCGECGVYLDSDVQDEREALESEGYNIEAMTAWAENTGETVSYDNRHDFDDSFCGEYDSFRDYADTLADELIESHGVTADGTLAMYFDYAAFARDLLLSGDFWTEHTSDGTGVWVFRSY